MSIETTNKKIKIDNGTTFGRTYTDKAVDELLKNIGGSGDGGSSVLRKDGTFVGKDEGVIVNAISLSPAEYNRIKNGEINIIYGDFRKEANVISNYKVEFSYDNGGDPYTYSYTETLVGDNKIEIFNYQLVINAENAILAVMITTQPPIPTLPSDASTKTYTLNSVNGILTWTDAIGDINTILDNINGEVI